MEEISLKFRLTAFAGLLAVFGLIYLYVKEFPVFSNTIGVKNLVIGSLLGALLLSVLLLYIMRERLSPFKKHWLECVIIVFPMLFFAPLAGSWINRSIYSNSEETFEYISEAPFVAEAYGLLKNHKMRPSGYQLTARKRGKLYQFKYKTQPYFPLSKPGDAIIVPIKKGLFGVKIVDLK